MYHLVTDELLIAANSVERSQAVALGENNAAQVQVWITNASGSLETEPLFVTVEVSDDLENWESTTITDSISSYPSSTYLLDVDTAANQLQLTNRYMRLHYDNSGQTVVCSAAVNTITVRK